MKPSEKEHAANVARIMAINDKLKAKGYNWEQIDQFWAETFREQEKLRNQKPQCPECLNYIDQEELDMFGGLCENCNENS